MQRARRSQGGTLVDHESRNVFAWEKFRHPPMYLRQIQGTTSPEQGRWSGASAQRLGLGETPAFQPAIWAFQEQRPCSGEIGPCKDPPWES